MKVKHITTAVQMDVPVGKAKRLVASGSWLFANEADQASVESAKPQPQGEDTPEAVEEPTEAPQAPEPATKPAPSIDEMRKWAQAHGVEGVKDKGKLSRRAIDAYLEAHKD